MVSLRVEEGGWMTKHRFQGVRVSEKQFNRLLSSFSKSMKKGVKEFNKALGYK